MMAEKLSDESVLEPLFASGWERVAGRDAFG